MTHDMTEQPPADAVGGADVDTDQGRQDVTQAGPLNIDDLIRRFRRRDRRGRAVPQVGDRP